MTESVTVWVWAGSLLTTVSVTVNVAGPSGCTVTVETTISVLGTESTDVDTSVVVTV